MSKGEPTPNLTMSGAKGVVVQKYGGSSVASPDKIRVVAERIMQTQQAGYAVCVVVSAMGDTTDDLLATAKRLSGNPPRRELDMLLSAGERIAMALLCIALGELGGDAISFTGSQSGIITNDRHSDARIIEVRPFRVQDELARGRIVVVAGYQGVSYKKEVTTLGRGGSDTTAVAMAAALGAAWCEICSDVDGVYSADPRVVPAARRLLELSYEETQEMAESGARVLNAQAVEFAKEKGIAIYARATAQLPPVETGRETDGTIVRRFAPRLPGSITSVVSERDVLVLEAEGAAMLPLLNWLEARGICGKQLHATNLLVTGGGSASAEHLTVVLSGESVYEDPASIRRALESLGSGSAVLLDHLGAVSAIGSGINANYRNVLLGSRGLEAAGIGVFGLATSSFRITWLVDRHRLDEAVRLLHAHYLQAPL